MDWVSKLAVGIYVLEKVHWEVKILPQASFQGSLEEGSKLRLISNLYVNDRWEVG